ncbi:hypothetical protein Lepto7375DRAFT_6877 [Leptolyngbya sp. PCC 7375]|nr:hypothetical protein Lepto7375DRAFT_6877 [Leptolyngbya sp. PCC 7375]
MGITPVLPSGNISITVKDDIILSGADVEIRADTSGDGAAGNIAINTGSFFAENGAGLSTGNLRGKGSGGNIIILAEDIISFSGVGTIPSSALVATAAEGNSGSIIFNSRLLSITDGAQISADTLSTGQGGDIFIDAEQVLIEGGNFLEGSNKASVSGIFATSQPEADGDSGSIELQIDTLTMNSGAQLAVGTGGSGDAGDILITATGPILVNGIGIEEIITEIAAETGMTSTRCRVL